MAEQAFESAEEQAGEIVDADNNGRDATFIGYATDDALAQAALAVVGWAACLESFINLAWNEAIGGKLPSSRINKQLLKTLSTMDKAKELLVLHNEDPSKLAFWSKLQSMIEIRNRFVHFKDNVVHQGFEFAAPWERELSQVHCREIREALLEVVQLIGKHVNLDTSFTSGKFSIVDRY
jgi:hypothetical protein